MNDSPTSVPSSDSERAELLAKIVLELVAQMDQALDVDLQDRNTDLRQLLGRLRQRNRSIGRLKSPPDGGGTPHAVPPLMNAISDSEVAFSFSRPIKASPLTGQQHDFNIVVFGSDGKYDESLSSGEIV